MKRIFLVGASGWGNVGDDLIAVKIVNWLNENGAEVVVSGGSKMPVSLPNGTRFVTADGSILSRINIIWSILRSDHIAIGGGGLLDDRSGNFYRPFLRVAQMAKRMRRPYSLVAIGVGPVRNIATREHYAQIAQGASSVSVRDAASRERLRECGVNREIDVVSDPALWRAGTAVRVCNPRFDLALNLRCWADRGSRQSGGLNGGLERIIDEVATSINNTHGEGSNIALVSMSELDGDQDSVALEMLAEKLRGDISKIYSCDIDEVERVASESRAVLSMRLHFCLIGISARTPTVGIGYDPKIIQQGQVHGFPTVELDGDFSAGRIEDALRDAAERGRDSYPGLILPSALL